MTTSIADLAGLSVKSFGNELVSQIPVWYGVFWSDLDQQIFSPASGDLSTAFKLGVASSLVNVVGRVVRQSIPMIKVFGV